MKPRNHVAVALSKRMGGSGAHVKRWKDKRKLLKDRLKKDISEEAI